jgi:site-specific DNA recombinase
VVQFVNKLFGKVAEGGALAIDENEQAVIEVIRRHRKSGKSYGAIVAYLNQKGFATKRGGKWASQTVANVYQRLMAV